MVSQIEEETKFIREIRLTIYQLMIKFNNCTATTRDDLEYKRRYEEITNLVLRLDRIDSKYL